MRSEEAVQAARTIVDRITHDRLLAAQKRQAHDDWNKKDDPKHEKMNATLAALDEKEQANLEDIVSEASDLVIGAVGAIFRIAEALEKIADSTVTEVR
jgi:hypothetical protein